ncbi:hypothetical protein D5S17_04250 [Pseudonocardiaceae bacterium YIM PH 21723]|nr:hypothetical protein D5S17_04250 [Pseudonocardiaceae bacterium YIM PH 21723]
MRVLLLGGLLVLIVAGVVVGMRLDAKHRQAICPDRPAQLALTFSTDEEMQATARQLSGDRRLTVTRSESREILASLPDPAGASSLAAALRLRYPQITDAVVAHCTAES